MFNSLAMWIPGPLELIVLMLAIAVLLANLMLIRWIFRVNEQIKLLSEIRDELKQLNTHKK